MPRHHDRLDKLEAAQPHIDCLCSDCRRVRAMSDEQLDQRIKELKAEIAAKQERR